MQPPHVKSPTFKTNPFQNIFLQVTFQQVLPYTEDIHLVYNILVFGDLRIIGVGPPFSRTCSEKPLILLK